MERINFLQAGFFFGLWLTICSSSAATLHVGPALPYATLTEAASVAGPGDSIIIHDGTYPGGLYLNALQGTATDWIYIGKASGDEVIFEGGTNAWQFSDASYLHIRGFIFQHQTGNGVNFDDGGSYDTPAHHVIFEECIFRNISATGNNDLLKLSGLDSFQIISCLFMNGSSGGSGIDMVGCHDGLISNCHFENQGSNSIQAKGGTRNITIEANFFKNGGARALNLGGSTGLQFFRPIDATYEAADLKVYSNVFVGSQAPVAFVGSVNCEVINNTIYLPEKWVMRILQETVDETRFAPCGYNTFRNNIIYLDDQVTVEVNIGPDTAPETFTMSNNLWYHADNAIWDGPVLPVMDDDHIIGQDPLFNDQENDIFSLLPGSPAIGAGYEVDSPGFDITGIQFLTPRSMGAYEGGETVGVQLNANEGKPVYNFYPNPANEKVFVRSDADLTGARISICDISGQQVPYSINHQNLNELELEIEACVTGLLLIRIIYADASFSHWIVRHLK